MPEGHTIHRLAQDCAERFTGRALRASSPQGKFADGAALLDGATLTGTEAHGKHLFLGFGPLGWVHVHLGLYGKFGFGEGRAPAPVGQVRLRLATPEAAGGRARTAARTRTADGAGTGGEGAAHYADLRGPTRCELITEPEKQAVHDRLGPDPLRPASDPEAAWARISRSRTTVAALLMDQKIVAGVGNVYRAEVLFRLGIDPYRTGRELTRAEWEAIWSDLVALMHEGVRNNRIDTVREEHTPEAMGRAPRVDDHGGEVYVYRRAHMPCHLCGTPVSTAELAARNLFWCPCCQRR
ncbi:Fpg/Nei family DNA glycosylase [Streptomyces iconiensis]|uniref:DNA-(apurinic or apyrimidinic site) lyase n=1 Tax=Streptomyces iconiensis TaxID=1384038 RepID=A0ABT7AA83_9ACTN|nr:DNA-formamidopyrimidine glycosylase family protein [Streptomyces iconiensis]MDJ1138247.1 DNA-formamidopyrimidine glycosylase family protein [Streptomyces iconiensis]